MTRRLGIPFADSRLVEVTARLQAGVAMPTWFPLPLDGILASAARRRTLGGAYGSVVDHHIVDLPLARGGPGCGARWCWAATCATPSTSDVEDVHWWHQRFDDAPAERVVDRLPAATDVGRYKPYRMPLVVTVTASLTWRCLGDPDRIRDLLGDVFALGKKTSQGEGYVIGWDVTDAGEPDWGPIQWTDDGHPARPWPARMAAWLGVPDAETVEVDAYRPPYWRAAPRCDEHGFSREPVEVIAPWTERPSPSTAV